MLKVQEASRAVFLSYASEDAEAAARLCEALRFHGIEVWFDRSELRGGDAWDQTIRHRIRDCKLFIPIISANSETRLEGYFRREWKLASDRMDDMASKLAFVVPVVIDDTDPPSAEVPDRFHQVQWTRLPQGEVTPVFVSRVAGLLGQARQDSPVAGPAVHPAPGPAAKSRPRRPWVMGLAALALIGAAVVSGRWLLNRATPAPKERSIAVLPFADLSEKKDQGYLADGIAEDILNLLMKIPDLKVVGRTSSFSLKDRQSDLKAIGQLLGVSYVLEGSVRRSDNRVRVTAQLLDTSDGTRRWANDFEATTRDTLNVEDDIATRVANALDLRLGRNLPARETLKSPQAYEFYLRGMQGLEDNSAESLDYARASFEKALKLEPGFGPAAVGIATVDQFKCADGFMPMVSCPQAHSSIDQAMKLDPKNPDIYATRAEMAELYDWDWAAAESDIETALKLGGGTNTNFAAARLAYATGQWDRARELLRGIIAGDPFDPDAFLDLGYFVEFRTGHIAEAEAQMRRALQIAPQYTMGKSTLAQILIAGGKLEEALALMQDVSPEDGRALGLALVYEALGKRSEADAEIKSMQVPPYQNSDIAIVYAFRGDVDRALSYLEKAYEVREPGLWFIDGDPLLKKISSHERFKAILRKMKLPTD